MRESRPRVFLVEDDPVLAGMMAEYLTGHGFQVNRWEKAEGAVRRILSECPDVVILDVMLPQGSGFDICRELRASWNGPVLFLTALGGETDEVVGLELGADDYVQKPVSPRVLLARLRALLRRNAADDGAETLLAGPLRMDLSSRTVTCGGVRVDLTTTEFDLLTILVRRAGRIQERARLVEELRGIDFHSFDRSVDVLVSRVRRKLDASPGGRDLIRTVRGVGYVFSAAQGEP